MLSAGYWKQMHPADWDTGVFDQHLRVNLTGMSNSIAAVLPGMLQRRSGTIAGIASVAGYRGLAGSEAYGATKSAQINLLESLRVHLARTGVHVTTICPGFVRTDLTAGSPFPMPFIIEAGQAARSICDGLEHDRTDRLPHPDGAADEDRAPRPRPCLDRPVGSHLAHLTHAGPGHLIRHQGTRRTP